MREEKKTTKGIKILHTSADPSPHQRFLDQKRGQESFWFGSMSFSGSVAFSLDSTSSNQADTGALTQNLQAVNGQRGNSPHTVDGGAACTRLERDTHVALDEAVC